MCALRVARNCGRRERRGWISSPLFLERTNGRWVVQRVHRWESEGEAWSEDEDASSTASREGNVCNDALHVVGLHGSGDKISLFLQDSELSKVALSCHMALDMLWQEMHEAWWMLWLPDESRVKERGRK